LSRLLLGGVSLFALVVFAGVPVVLDRYGSYRSPLYRGELGRTPRMQALDDIESGELMGKEVQRLELKDGMTPQELVELGQGIVYGKGTCLAVCHTLGAPGGRAPDLEGIGARASTRVEGLAGLEYLAQSLYDPEAYSVPGFSLVMPPVHEPPIELTDDEVLVVIAFLQSLGGEPSVTPRTDLSLARPH
jgi:hypothetical protein